MPKIISSNSLIFLLATLITLALIFSKFNINWLQRIVAVLLFLLLIFLNKVLTISQPKAGSSKKNSLIKKLFLLLVTLFVQLIIISTGGLKSPFIVLVHLFTLGASFLIDLSAALAFLMLTLLTILADFWWDKNIQSLFQGDPGSVLLYLVSFVVIIPLSVLVTRYYYLKDTIANILSQEVKLKEMQQQSLLSGLNELVLIVDRNLNIISANEAAGKLLSLTGSMILRRHIFDVLFLKDANENMMSQTTLLIDQIVNEKSIRQFDSLSLFTKNTALPRKVSLTVRPIINLEGIVDQITFIISDSSRSFTDSKLEHAGLEEARARHKAMIEGLKGLIDNQGLIDLKARTELIDRMQQDLLSATEVEDHIVGGRTQNVDIAELCKRVMIVEVPLAQILKVRLEFKLLNFDNRDTDPLVPKDLNVSPINLTAPFFTAAVDTKWFNILISRIVDLSILLTSGLSNPIVQLTIEREGNRVLVINVNTNYPGLSEEESKLLLIQYFGLLGRVTNLRFGSGLEGFIAKQVALSLNIPLVIISEKGKVGVSFRLWVSKQAL